MNFLSAVAWIVVVGTPISAGAAVAVGLGREAQPPIVSEISHTQEWAPSVTPVAFDTWTPTAVCEDPHPTCVPTDPSLDASSSTRWVAEPPSAP
jgi:hypothetical protein